MFQPHQTGLHFTIASRGPYLLYLLVLTALAACGKSDGDTPQPPSLCEFVADTDYPLLIDTLYRRTDSEADSLFLFGIPDTPGNRDSYIVYRVSNPTVIDGIIGDRIGIEGRIYASDEVRNDYQETVCCANEFFCLEIIEARAL